MQNFYNQHGNGRLEFLNRQLENTYKILTRDTTNLWGICAT